LPLQAVSDRADLEIKKTSRPAQNYKSSETANNSWPRVDKYLGELVSFDSNLGMKGTDPDLDSESIYTQ